MATLEIHIILKHQIRFVSKAQDTPDTESLCPESKFCFGLLTCMMMDRGIVKESQKMFENFIK